MDLLDYGRIDAKENKSAFNAGDAVDSAQFALHSQIVEKHATIMIRPLPVIFQNRMIFEQLVQNILENSLRFHSSSPPTIEICAVRFGRFWEFRVKDNGIGIEAKYLEQVLKPFEKLHSRDKYEGSGLGLAICQRILEDMGGRIWLENHGEKPGITVHFTIPST
jgi:light-regulated signal transduction histidine kinase (bacteriophytochrome)